MRFQFVKIKEVKVLKLQNQIRLRLQPHLSLRVASLLIKEVTQRNQNQASQQERKFLVVPQKMRRMNGWGKFRKKRKKNLEFAMKDVRAFSRVRDRGFFCPRLSLLGLVEESLYSTLIKTSQKS